MLIECTSLRTVTGLCTPINHKKSFIKSGNSLKTTPASLPKVLLYSIYLKLYQTSQNVEKNTLNAVWFFCKCVKCELADSKLIHLLLCTFLACCLMKACFCLSFFASGDLHFFIVIMACNLVKKFTADKRNHFLMINCMF